MIYFNQVLHSTLRGFSGSEQLRRMFAISVEKLKEISRWHEEWRWNCKYLRKLLTNFIAMNNEPNLNHLNRCRSRQLVWTMFCPKTGRPLWFVRFLDVWWSDAIWLKNVVMPFARKVLRDRPISCRYIYTWYARWCVCVCLWRAVCDARIEFVWNERNVEKNSAVIRVDLFSVLCF